MEQFVYNRYYAYEDIEQMLFALRDAHPDVCKLEALAKTDAGRTIWGVTLAANCTAEDTPDKRPGFYVQGGLHAEEGMGITAALALMYTMLEDPQARKQLETVTVYILPCINPDGSNDCLTKGLAIRSMLESLPEDTPNALIPCDLDGDGRILTMRWEDPTGAWKMAPGCGDMMVLRQPGDTDGPFYHLCTEGMIKNYDGGKEFRSMRSLDLNRQFARNWSDTPNGGDYPGRHVEPRTVMEFLLNHPNIFAAFDIHCGTSALIYDNPTNQADAALMRKMTKLGNEITGLQPVPESEYARSPGAKPTVLPGVFRGYVQDTFGLLIATIELGNGWNSIGMTAQEIWAQPTLMAPELISKIMALHEANGSQIAAPWVKYNHPQLGEVEIGGHIQGNAYLMLANDMAALLPRITQFLQKMMLWHPKLELVNVSAEALGGDVVRVRADVINTGLLGTRVLKCANGYHASYPLYLSVSGAEQILNRTAVAEFKSLDPLEFQKVEWFVRAKTGTKLTITATHPKSGVACAEVTVE